MAHRRSQYTSVGRSEIGYEASGLGCGAHLNYAGALDAIEEHMKKEGIALIDGISLGLKASRTKRADPSKRLMDWNERRRQRVLARLAKAAAPPRIETAA